MASRCLSRGGEFLRGQQHGENSWRRGQQQSSIRVNEGEVYGVTTASGSGLNSNDIVGETRHPDPATGAASATLKDVVTVSALGQTLSSTDRNGTTHEYGYNAIGRLTVDRAVVLGNGIDGSVRRQEFRQDTLGGLVLATQFDATTGGNVVSQVARQFNGFGQLTVEFQAVAGAVNVNTPSVQYGYSEATGGVNHSRLTNMTYPDGRVLSYDYGSANSTNDRISRLACITDSTGTLESYEYLGLSTVVIRSHPQADVSLSYLIYAPLAFGEAGDIYSGLDRFGRVVDQRWVQGNGTEIDRFQYGYDRNSNRLWRDNLMNASFGELYGYDNLGQLTSMQRGELNGNRTGLVGNATRSQDWAYDPLGNWNGVTTDGVEETRTHDAQNRVVGVGNATLAFDPTGNMLTDEQGQQYTYDAWNRLKSVWDSGNTVIASYEYDALRRRVVETHGNETKDLYYSSQWQVLEERDAATGNTTMSYAWSPVYVDAMISRDRDTDDDGSLDERLWVQQDANWNVTSIVDGSGVVVERYSQTPYGVVTIYSPTYGAVRSVSDYDFQYLMQGLRRDEATGLYHARNRDLDPELGRPIQSDPLGLAPDVNSYRWEYGSPGNFVDPSGLADWYWPWEKEANWGDWRVGTAASDIASKTWDETKMVGGYVINNPASATWEATKGVGHGVNNMVIQPAYRTGQLGRDYIGYTFDRDGTYRPVNPHLQGYVAGERTGYGTVFDLTLDGTSVIPIAQAANRGARGIKCLTSSGKGVVRDPKSLADFTLAEQLDMRMKHQSLLSRLGRGDVEMPSGSMSASLMGELTVASGKEVALIRLGGQRFLRLGSVDGVFVGDAQRLIAHTHPSGTLRFSTGAESDMAVFMNILQRQKSSVLIAPDGTAIRLPIIK